MTKWVYCSKCGHREMQLTFENDEWPHGKVNACCLACGNVVIKGIEP